MSKFVSKENLTYIATKIHNKYLAKAGGTITGSLTVNNGVYAPFHYGVNSKTLIYDDGTYDVVGNTERQVHFATTDTDLMHNRNGNYYPIITGYNIGSYSKYINTGNIYTISSSNMINTTWTNNVASGWLYIVFYSGSDNGIYGNVVLNGVNVMTIQRVRHSDLGFLIPVKQGDQVRLWLDGIGYEARDCKLFY